MNDSSSVSKWQNATPYFHALLRIMAALILIPAGGMILFAFPVGMPPNGATAPIMSQTGIGGIIEFVGGILLLIGLLTRPVAFLLSGTMAVAFFQFHFKPEWPAGIVPNLNNGMPAYLLCFINLFLSAAGAGPWSIDAMRRKSS